LGAVASLTEVSSWIEAVSVEAVSVKACHEPFMSSLHRLPHRRGR
jgi:hypothetical protein